MQKLPLLALLAMTLAPMAWGQNTVTLPSGIAVWSKSNIPVAAPPIRYQQWFAPSEFLGGIGHPARITGLSFIGGSPGGQAGAQIDIEVRMGNGPTFQPGGFLDQNLQNQTAQWPLAPVTVLPRSLHTLAAASAGQPVLTLTFQEDFVWDGVSGVTVDFKMFDNGTGNTARNYDLQFTNAGAGRVYSMWGLNADPRTVQFASIIQRGWGVTMDFTWEDGVSVSYGTGCPGAGGIVPFATTTGGLPLPANSAWTQVVNNANSQQSCALFLGSDNTMIGGASLPYDLSQIGITGNCFLLNNSLIAMPTTTVGGGIGLGTATINIPIPPVTIFAGQSLYTQWLILDASAPNGVLAVSQGVESIFG